MKDILIVIEDASGDVSFKDYSCIEDRQGMLLDLAAYTNTIGVKKITIWMDPKLLP